MDQSPWSGVLLDHAQDVVVVLDDQGTFTYVNAAAERVLGYDPDALLGETAFEYVHDDDVAAAEASFAETIAADGFAEATLEHRFRAGDGSWVWLESRLSNLTDEVLDGYVVSARDVSDRVAAERDSQETATRLEELAAVSGDVLWVFDGDWSEVLFVNEAYETVYGASTDRLEGDPGSFVETIHPDDVPRVRDAMACVSSGTSVEMEYRVNPRRGYDVWVWVQAEPIVRDGDVVRITGFTRDVTDRRRRQRQLYVMDKLLRHNLRNDLTTILGNADLIEERAPGTADRVAVIRRTGEELLASAEKQRDMIELLTGDPSPKPVDVAEAVRTGLETVRDRFPEATITVDSPSEARACGVDELGLAVAELVENAVRHSERDRPSVDVTVRPESEGVTVDVVDDAPPIPACEAQVLTGDHEMTDVYHSTGLGLWLVYWAVELSDGEVAVSSDADAGNRVRITLPSPPE